MSATADLNYAAPNTRLSDMIRSIVPGGIKRDPLGFVSGYRAYAIYTRLASLSDTTLAGMSIDRRDLPRVAMDAARASLSGT